MFLKQFLLSLLMAALSGISSAVYIVICGNHRGTLDCGNDVIQVISAKYGRADKVTCSVRQPRKLVQTTNCDSSGTSDIVVQRCNGKKRCDLEATNVVFGDHCFGTYKYLVVSYKCLHLVTSVTCEGKTARLSCGTGVLRIWDANYGRTDTTTCAAGKPSSQVSNTNCFASSSLSVVKNRCEGKKKCTVPATNDMFPEPCVGTYKYLTVVYVCKS
ncbi:rhamnose-binding lectin-like [Hoplias malabaricus]|uniref:rhamnose-binding lectin-like n=1 Tax=Hoplias malabaricus TaxID=27720 RepID=UPI003461E9A8